MLRCSHLLQCRSLSRLAWKSSIQQPCTVSKSLHPYRCASVTAWHAKNHYELLGLRRDASQAEIKDAFVKLSKEYHPDMNPTDPHTHDKFVKLHEAYQVLSRPRSRREYDVSIAHNFHFQQRMASQGFTSHYPSSSNMPGGMGASSGPSFDGGDSETRQFWDETIYNMRKTTADDFYPEDQYYGVKGVRKQKNVVIVFGCMILIGVGITMHLATIKYSRHFSREILDKKDRINFAYLQETKARAKLYGNSHQIEILRARVKAAEEKKITKMTKSSS